MHGYFDQRRIYIDLQVWGLSKRFVQKFKAQIDTGYDGYLQLPFSKSLSLGLILKGTQTYTLADGGNTHNLVCLGTVKFGSKDSVVPIDVGGESILVGNLLLKELGVGFNVDYLNENINFRKCRKIKQKINRQN